jgi:Tail fiber protein gp32
MANKTITSANAILVLSINSVYPTPIQLQGFAVDDIYDVPAIKPSENLRGVDGKMSSGFVFNNIEQNIALQADSASNDIFDNWFQQMQVIADILYAYGKITLVGIGKTYNMNKGALSSYEPMAAAKKVLQQRKFAITWESVTPVPV